MSKLFNPFRYIAGWESLAGGVFVLFVTSVIGYYSHIHFPDLLSVKTTGGIPFSILLIQGLSNWLVLSILLYLSALLFSKSTVRVIDIFGTQSLARTPYMFAALTGFTDLLTKFGNYMMWTALKTGEEVILTNGEMFMALILILFTMLLTVWMISLMFNAFKISANLKGATLIIPFIVSIIASIVITGKISTYFINLLHV